MTSFRKLRTLRFDSLLERLIWSFRLSRLEYQFPRTYEDWNNDDFDPDKIQLLWKAWEFLRPFFASRGYILYKKLPNSDALAPLSTPGPAPSDFDTYPYARRISPEHTPELPIVVSDLSSIILLC